MERGKTLKRLGSPSWQFCIGARCRRREKKLRGRPQTGKGKRRAASVEKCTLKVRRTPGNTEDAKEVSKAGFWKATVERERNWRTEDNTIRTILRTIDQQNGGFQSSRPRGGLPVLRGGLRGAGEGDHQPGGGRKQRQRRAIIATGAEMESKLSEKAQLGWLVWFYGRIPGKQSGEGSGNVDQHHWGGSQTVEQ